MNLLTPWFLAGLVLIAGPIIAHLIRRATRERLTFSALRFLDASAPRLDRRSRVQNPWLLALRCLIVAVLAFGFARPFLRVDTPALATPAVPRHVVAVLDESASMRRAGLWDAAREKIAAFVAGLGPTDRFVLVSVGDRVTDLISSAQWTATTPEARAALVHSVLDPRQPGWGPTPLDSAAESALAHWEEMAESDEGSARRELVLVSDFASGARVAGLANLAWPTNAEVVLEPVTPALLGNASLHWLGWSEQDPAKPAARVRLSRSFDAPESLRVQWRDARTSAPLGEPASLTLLPGASEVRLIPLPENAPPAVRLDLEGDAQDFDNQLWLVRPSPRNVDLAYLGGHPANDSQHARFYIERAIAGWREPTGRVTTELSANDAHQLIIVAAPLDPAPLTATRARIEAGAFALVLLDRDELVATAAALAGETGWSTATTARADALLGQLDFQHPLFAPFADPLYSDFTRIRFWQPRSVTLPSSTNATVVARFDDESPAVLEVPVGQGRLVIWGGGWSPTASQWVLSSKFVPWLQALAERAAGGPAQAAIAEIGSVTLPETAAAAPGLYDIPAGSTTRPLALNVPSAESQTEPLTLETWEQLGVPLRDGTSGTATSTSVSVSATQTAAALENRQQVWRWLLWLAVALLAIESLASFAVSRRAVSTP